MWIILSITGCVMKFYIGKKHFNLYLILLRSLSGYDSLPWVYYISDCFDEVESS